jgi:uncharacterized DUF497 family protein
VEGVLLWVWDPDKDRRNRSRHKLPLSLGEMALADPLALSRPDPHPDGDRWDTVAVVDGMTLFVAHTWPDDGTPGRIISVRQATTHERKAYEDGEY